MALNKQQILDALENGKTLHYMGIHCGNPSAWFVDYEIAHKGSCNALLKKGLLEKVNASGRDVTYKLKSKETEE